MVSNRRAQTIRGVFVTLLAMIIPQGVVALPFNQDMSFGQNLPAGNMMRAPAPESIALGSLERRLDKRDDALALTNPLPGDAWSTSNGARLWRINCSPCHGYYKGSDYQRGVVQSQVPGPDLSDPTIVVKPDGHFYQFIHFGGMAIMPAYGWKLSPTEHWDIVNFVRKFQAERGQVGLKDDPTTTNTDTAKNSQ